MTGYELVLLTLAFAFGCACLAYLVVGARREVELASIEEPYGYFCGQCRRPVIASRGRCARCGSDAIAEATQ